MELDSRGCTKNAAAATLIPITTGVAMCWGRRRRSIVGGTEDGWGRDREEWWL